MCDFSFKDGGTVVQYLLGKVLKEYGQNVKIYPGSGKKTKNSRIIDTTKKRIRKEKESESKKTNKEFEI